MRSDGTFITGSDFLMDGGVTATYWFGPPIGVWPPFVFGRRAAQYERCSPDTRGCNMKVISKSRAVSPRRNVPTPTRPPIQDHDLPILAAEQMPARQTDWKPLLEDGIQPAHFIGGERRWHGRR